MLLKPKRMEDKQKRTNNDSAGQPNHPHRREDADSLKRENYRPDETVPGFENPARNEPKNPI